MLLISVKYKRIIHTPENPTKYSVLFLWQDYPETLYIQGSGADVNCSSTHSNECRSEAHKPLAHFFFFFTVERRRRNTCTSSSCLLFRVLSACLEFLSASSVCLFRVLNLYLHSDTCVHCPILLPHHYTGDLLGHRLPLVHQLQATCVAD